ncbi:MAG: ShlB/FhaC/HecB family hemolysin secretion/activation protein [Desulfovibrionaceae bacterium]|nr:ShlB/FhaC/HecB family hemolysin secretion/activation protein [Desulfovibrionaceae bacterium]
MEIIRKLFLGIACCAMLALVCMVDSGYAADSNVIIDRERTRAHDVPKSQPKVQIEEEKSEPTLQSGTVLTLRSITVTGSSVFSQEELLAPYKSLFGTKISYEKLRAISREMTKKYRDAGYVLSRVIMPPQSASIDNADIQLIALEGFIDSIEYSGDSKVLERFKRYFASIEKKFLAMKPLKHSDFERYMLLMKDVPGIEISSRFERGAVSGGSKLRIDVQGDFIDGSLSFGNTGTDETGPILGSVSLALNTLPLVGNKTSVTYTQAMDAQEYHSIQVANRYQFWNGLLFSLSYAFSASPELDSDFANMWEYSTNSTTWNVGLAYPLIRSRDMNLSLGLNYENRNSDSYLSEDHFQRDRLRTLSANVNFDFADSFGGITQLIATVYRGMNILYATDESRTASNTEAPAEYWKFDFYASREQQLPHNFSLFGSAEAQFSTASLSSYNRFSYGGSQFGRGYEPGLLEGDNALALTFEPRYTMYPTDATSLQFFSFIDYGSIWNTEEIKDIPEREYGASVGFGIRYWGHIGSSKMPDFKLSAYIGQPLRPVEDNNADSPRLVLQGAIFF